MFHSGALELVFKTVHRAGGDFQKALELCGSAMDMGMESHDTPKISQIAGMTVGGIHMIQKHYIFHQLYVLLI